MVKLNKKSKILALHKRLGKLFENNTAALILGIIGVMLFILGFIIPTSIVEEAKLDLQQAMLKAWDWLLTSPPCKYKGI